MATRSIARSLYDEARSGGNGLADPARKLSDPTPTGSASNTTQSLALGSHSRGWRSTPGGPGLYGSCDTEAVRVEVEAHPNAKVTRVELSEGRLRVWVTAAPSRPA